MENNKSKKNSLRTVFFRLHLRLILVLGILFPALLILQFVSAQETIPVETLPPTDFQVGERLTYNFSFGNINNAAFAEMQVVSRGKLEGRDAVELRSKIKTNGFIGAVFYLIDETRTTFASAETGLPLLVRKTSMTSGLPRESVENYLTEPSINYDLLTLLYQVRKVGGIGSFPFFEDGKNYQIDLQNTISERVQTSAGDFETSVSTVQSEYLTEKGIRDFRINFSQDERRLPVLIRFRTDKGVFRGEIASIQVLENKPPPTPTPTPTVTPVPVRTPVPTPTPFPENQPLSPNLAFQLGETLEFKVTNNGQNFGNITLQASERKQIQERDTLFLSARVTGTDQGNNLFGLNDGIFAQVNPETLAPIQIELKFNRGLSQFNQTIIFDQKAGTASFTGQVFQNMPVGTHSLLSLAYAIRSFNLKPSLDEKNPVNDTRVAVFVGERPYVFILRPSNAEILTFGDRKISAQKISIRTGNPNFDRYNFQLWLSTDEKRVPLRFTAGTYQADLISQKVVPPGIIP